MGSNWKLGLLLVLCFMVSSGLAAWLGQAVFIRNHSHEPLSIHCTYDSMWGVELENRTIDHLESYNWVFSVGPFTSTKYTCNISSKTNGFYKFDVFGGKAPHFPCIENYWSIKKNGIYYYGDCINKGSAEYWQLWYRYPADKNHTSWTNQRANATEVYKADYEGDDDDEGTDGDEFNFLDDDDSSGEADKDSGGDGKDSGDDDKDSGGDGKDSGDDGKDSGGDGKDSGDDGKDSGGDGENSSSTETEPFPFPPRPKNSSSAKPKNSSSANPKNSSSKTPLPLANPGDDGKSSKNPPVSSGDRDKNSVGDGKKS